MLNGFTRGRRRRLLGILSFDQHASSCSDRSCGLSWAIISHVEPSYSSGSNLVSADTRSNLRPSTTSGRAASRNRTRARRSLRHQVSERNIRREYEASPSAGRSSVTTLRTAEEHPVPSDPTGSSVAPSGSVLPYRDSRR
jgi:hypothetical protein